MCLYFCDCYQEIGLFEYTMEAETLGPDLEECERAFGQFKICPSVKICVAVGEKCRK